MNASNTPTGVYHLISRDIDGSKLFDYIGNEHRFYDHADYSNPHKIVMSILLTPNQIERIIQAKKKRMACIYYSHQKRGKSGNTLAV